MTTGPRQLVNQLIEWAEATAWVDWLELGGSLGRGEGDEWSDVDAGVGILGDPTAEGTADVRDAALSFAAAADHLVQQLGTEDAPVEHLIVQYRDGRQLSLVVMPAIARTALPPEAAALVDKSGRLSTVLPTARFDASTEQRHEWSFLAWIALGDAGKHLDRGSVWRALRSLGEARSYAFQLHAAQLGVTYPRFGEVSLENAGAELPPGIAATHPATLAAEDVRGSIGALSSILDELTAEHEVGALSAVTKARLGGSS